MSDTGLEGLTVEALEERQEAELEELRQKQDALIEAAKVAAGKGKKAKEKVEAAEREAEQLEYDMRQRHAEEMEQLQEMLGGGSAAATATEAPAPKPANGGKATEVVDEEDPAKRKKEKALKKRQNRAAKEADKEAAKEQERMADGPSARELELDALKQRLDACSPPLEIVEVAADGNCLYHAVADQLRRTQPDRLKLPRASAHEEVRGICAASLRRREDVYSPFAELKDGEDFAGYCNRVESSCDWGGELELRALADELGAKILVHTASDAEPLVLGEGQDGGQVLRVAFHRHYYALGEHYNSVAPKGGRK